MKQMPARADDLLADARRAIDRLTPSEVNELLREGATVIDIRPAHQRERDGLVEGAIVIERNVFEWRCDPQGAHRDPRIGDTDRPIVVVCNQGYQSSLAAANLAAMGYERAADMIGGLERWRADGLPMVRATR